MGKLSKKLKGSTLIETIVSMMIIVLIMTILTTCLYKINLESGLISKPLAYFMVKQHINNLEEQNNIELKYDNFPFTIVRNLTKYENTDDLMLLEVKALNMDGKNIISVRKIVGAYEIYKTDELNNILYEK